MGKRILLRNPAAPWAEVIGVVAHQRLSSLAQQGRETIYFRDGFEGIGVSRSWLVRTAGNPAKYALVIKPLEEDSTPGTVKPFQASLVEPVAYQFQLDYPYFLFFTNGPCCNPGSRRKQVHVFPIDCSSSNAAFLAALLDYPMGGV